MIVRKSWLTARYIRSTRYESKFGPWRIGHWRGWFLFGIVPIYIEETGHSYETAVP